MGGGALFAVKKATALILSVTFFFVSFLSSVSPAAAINGLDLAKDTVSSIAPNIPNMGHDIFFVLPVNSQQIDPSTWVSIDFPNYLNVQPATSVLGGFGTPTFSASGKRVQLTNFALLPGTSLDIMGITANNPDINHTNQIVITISNDQAATQVRNQITVIPTTSGDSVEVSAIITPPLAGLSISGFTSPQAFTTLIEGGAVVGTVVASGTGFFNFTLSGLTPGAHTYSITSADTAGLGSAVSTLSLFLLANTLTTATGIMLSPTITINKTSINPGDTITVSGSAEPSSQINIFLESPLRSYTATSANDGTWSYTIPGTETSQLSPGQYRVYTLSQDTSGNQSPISPSVNFTVNTSGGSNPPPNCDISHGDLNCDGKTNLTDFSILLFYWGTNQKRADINKDGQVNLTDFSIMMFYFQA